MTAAGQGIGRAIAEAFAREGARVWATDLDIAKLEGLGGVELRKLDVLSDDAVAALARETGAVDILVNAAGFVHHGTVLECSDRDWDFSFDLNVKSMHRTIKAYLPGMLEKGDRARSSTSRPAPRPCAAFPNRYVYGATQGGGDRPDQGGRGGFHQARHPLQRDLPWHDPVAFTRRAHRGAGEDQAARASQRCARPSSTVSPWAASAPPRKSRRSRSISLPMRSSYTTGQIHLVDGGFAL